jgi:transposase InsO family protein
MTFTMENLERLTLAEMQEFVEGNREVEFRIETRAAAYGFIETVLKAQQYRRLSKGQRGVVRRFLAKVTGLSRAQLTRLVGRWRRSRRVTGPPRYRPCFPTRYTPADVALLAAVDAAHEDLSGPAVRHILQREFQVFGKTEYQRLAGLSVSHLYNLRRSVGYRNHRVTVQHTQARQVSIAERRKPDPRGQPGYLRVDTVHQGNPDGHPGVYHINAVDTVTQWQVVGCVETISELHLIPVLEAMLHQFPFRILGFHCDNGSEFLNRKVAGLLNKLLVEFTKSRPYRTTDNALVEGKNGAVIRKHIGYGAIPAQHAESFQKFYTAYFNPYLNFHRPCGFATLEWGRGGKRRRRYPPANYCTPYEKLISLANWKGHLKEGVTPEQLQQQATRMSDTQAALQMQKVKTLLLRRCRITRTSAPPGF